MVSARLLGGASLHTGNGAVAGPPAQRHRLALVALLALSHSQPLSRDKLIALLWPNRDGEHARGLLKQSVHALRRAFGERAIVSSGDALSLDPEAVSSDVRAFEVALAAGALAEAVSLYTGPLLDGFHLPDAPDFERWLDSERDRLRRAYIEALQRLGEAAATRGDMTGAAERWRQVVAEDPYSGRVTVRLMEVLDTLGDRTGALEQARVHTLLLREEFEAEPDPRVTALAERLRGDALGTPHRDARNVATRAASPPNLGGHPVDRFAKAGAFAEAIPGESTAPRTRWVPPRHAHLNRVKRGFGIALGLCAVMIVLLAGFIVTRPKNEQPVTAFVLNFERRERLASSVGPPFAVSVDGGSMVYAASRGSSVVKLFLRRLGELRARELPGTDGASNPVFSTDGKWIAFVAGNQLKKVAVAGGAPIPLGQVSYSAVRGISWSRNGTLVVGAVAGNMRLVDESGGEMRSFVPDSVGTNEVSPRWPVVLPDGDHVVYTSWRGGQLGDRPLWIASLSLKTARPLSVIGTMALGVVGDQLVYVSPNGGVMAAHLDAKGLRMTGTPLTLPEQVAVDANAGWARASLSQEGTLVYQTDVESVELDLVDLRTREQRPLLAGKRAYGFPRFSPDGGRIAMSIAEGSGIADVWIFDRAAKTLQKLTGGGGAVYDRPEWTPDGKRVLYRASFGTNSLVWQSADRSGAPERLAGGASGAQHYEGVISPNGEWLLTRTNAKDRIDIWYRRLTGDTTTQSLIESPYYETSPRFSPDGKWVAFTSDESGTRQVYVTPFPGPGARYQVSLDGGESPVWAPDGRRLFYVRDPQLIAATVSLAPTFAIGERSVELDGGVAFNYMHANYDIAPDGRHLIVLKRDGEEQAIVIRGWGSLLRSRAKSN